MYDFSSNLHKILDLKGSRCPETIMIIRKVVRNMYENENLLVISDDPVIKYDILDFCRFMGHKLSRKNIEKIPYLYLIQKKSICSDI